MHGPMPWPPSRCVTVAVADEDSSSRAFPAARTSEILGAHRRLEFASTLSAPTMPRPSPRRRTRSRRGWLTSRRVVALEFELARWRRMRRAGVLGDRPACAARSGPAPRCVKVRTVPCSSQLVGDDVGGLAGVDHASPTARRRRSAACCALMMVCNACTIWHATGTGSMPLCGMRRMRALAADRRS